MNYDKMLTDLALIEKSVYQICKSLIYIVDTECCTYGQDDSVKMAEDYIVEYEEDHPELKGETDGKETT